MIVLVMMFFNNKSRKNGIDKKTSIDTKTSIGGCY